jgi:hypothetical protein
MMKAIRAALVPSDSQDHLRVVCFLTDGYVGNDLEIIGEVQKHANARVFAYGVGTAVNRFLIEGMAKAGRGDSEIVTLNDKADAAAHRLYERLRSPILTDVSIDWGGLPVTDVLPKQVPDLFSGKPLILSGRYTSAASGTIRIHGKRAGEDFMREIPVTLSGNKAGNSIVSTFWARRKIDDLMSLDWAGLQSGNMKPAVQKEITQLGLDYGLMTQFTSFVAVEERVVTTGGTPHTVEVPIEMPEGVSYEGVFGSDEKVLYANKTGPTMYLQMGMARVAVGTGSGGGYAPRAVAGNIGGPASMGRPAPPPPPPGVGSTSVVSRGAAPPHTADPYHIPDQKLSPERATLESKLSPALMAVFDCWKKQGLECKSLKEGSVEIQLFFTDDSSGAIDQVKALGFTVSEERPKQDAIVGRMAAEKLAELAQMKSVRFVALVTKPQG